MKTSSSRSDGASTVGEHPSVSETQRGATALVVSNGDGAVDVEEGNERVGSEPAGDMSEYMDDFDEED